jgi:hypothetical protein
VNRNGPGDRGKQDVDETDRRVSTGSRQLHRKRAAAEDAENVTQAACLCHKCGVGPAMVNMNAAAAAQCVDIESVATVAAEF